jgi:hypothetical protein
MEELDELEAVFCVERRKLEARYDALFKEGIRGRVGLGNLSREPSIELLGNLEPCLGKLLNPLAVFLEQELLAIENILSPLCFLVHPGSSHVGPVPHYVFGMSAELRTFCSVVLHWEGEISKLQRPEEDVACGTEVSPRTVGQNIGDLVD